MWSYSWILYKIIELENIIQFCMQYASRWSVNVLAVVYGRDFPQKNTLTCLYWILSTAYFRVFFNLRSEKISKNMT